MIVNDESGGNMMEVAMMYLKVLSQCYAGGIDINKQSQSG
jgi:hypothetical protein